MRVSKKELAYPRNQLKGNERAFLHCTFVCYPDFRIYFSICWRWPKGLLLSTITVLKMAQMFFTLCLT